MKRKMMSFAIGLLTLSTLFYGCGSKHVETTEVPKPAQEEAKPTSIPRDQYTVVKHDTLWAIAGKNSIYGDSFEWPLIFKANRDAIKDPDLIYPRQNFTIEKGLSDSDVSQAKKLASKTPKFAPHSEPRQTLPIDYF